MRLQPIYSTVNNTTITKLVLVSPKFRINKTNAWFAKTTISKISTKTYASWKRHWMGVKSQKQTELIATNAFQPFPGSRIIMTRKAVWRTRKAIIAKFRMFKGMIRSSLALNAKSATTTKTMIQISSAWKETSPTAMSTMTTTSIIARPAFLITKTLRRISSKFWVISKQVTACRFPQAPIVNPESLATLF